MSRANPCAKCGACTSVCPVYQITGRESLTARGRLHLLERLPAAQQREEACAGIFSRCLLCGGCRDVCPRQVDIPGLIIKAREAIPLTAQTRYLPKYLARQVLAHPFLLKNLSLLARSLNHTLFSRLPAESGLRLKLAFLEPDQEWLAATASESAPLTADIRPQGETLLPAQQISYYPGCMARHLNPEISRATTRLLAKGGQAPLIPSGQTCCGLAAFSSGNVAEAKILAKKNIASFEPGEGPILASCASCYSHLLSYAGLLADELEWRERATHFVSRLREFSSFFLEYLQSTLEAVAPVPSGVTVRRVLYHDPCHLRFGPKITVQPRQLLAALPGLKLLELPHGPQCCGLGGLFNIAHPELSSQIFTRLQQDAATLGADLVTSTCSGCLIQWRQGLTGSLNRTRVVHLAVLLAEML